MIQPEHSYNSHYGNGVRNVYLLVLSSWKINIVENPIAVMYAVFDFLIRRPLSMCEMNTFFLFHKNRIKNKFVSVSSLITITTVAVNLLCT